MLFMELCSLDAPVAYRGGELVCFAEFAKRAAAWRSAFVAHGGQHFALYFAEDTLDFAAALMGLWHAGKTAWLPGDALPATLSSLAAHVDGYVGDMPASVRPLPDEPAEPWATLDEQAQQLVIFTSGSTGAPAAIPKRLGQLFSEVRALQQVFGERVGKAEVLATVSHQHIYGLLFRVLWPLASGRVFHAERLSYIEDIPRTGSHVLIASPAHLKRLPEAALDLRAVFSSGGPLPDAAVPDCIAKLGQAPVEVYGSSETGGVAWRQRSGVSNEWQALPGVQWRLQDETLEIRSPHLQDDDIWTATADRACASDHGFTLLGRADRVLKIEEKRVSLSAVEQALLATALVQDLRVLTLPGPREQLAIVAVPTEAGWTMLESEGKAALTHHLRAALRQSLDAVALPRRWRFVSALPGNAQGKTTLEALRLLFDPRRPQPRVLAVTSTSASLRIVADAALPQFDGHFSEHPVLPGVAQIEWAILLGRELFAALPPRFLALEGLKFQQVITPGKTIELQLDFKPEAGKLTFKYSSEQNGQHASGRILFGAAES